MTDYDVRPGECWNCALREGHDGCCAYFCSGCAGAGRTCFDLDDLGCNCGVCDGDGTCSDCGGAGWFNEFGEPCMTPGPDELPVRAEAAS